MKRDFDLIRDILLNIEAHAMPVPKAFYYHFEHDDRDAVANSLELMLDRGLIDAQKSPHFDAHPSDWYGMVRLTWEGHDFLDSIRDAEIWRRTKEGASQAGGMTFELLKALAKGFVKKKIEDHTGIKLDLGT